MCLLRGIRRMSCLLVRLSVEDSGMLEEFKKIYGYYGWLRYITWLGLLCATLFLLWASGGFFPQALLLFIHTLFQFPYLWRVQGVFSLLSLLALFLMLLIWIGVWYLLLRSVLLLLRHHH